MFLNIKLKRIWGFHHKWYILSLKDSETLCMGQGWKPILNGWPWSLGTLKHTRFSSRIYCMGSGTLLKAIVCEHISLCIHKCRLKYHHAKKPYMNIIQICHCLLRISKFKTLFEFMEPTSSRLKRREIIWLVISTQCKSCDGMDVYYCKWHG